MSNTRDSSVGRNGGARNSERSVENPAALSSAFDGWQRASQVSLIGLFVIALVWCAYVAQHIIIPVLLAWAIATILLPVVRWLQARGIPRAAAVLAVALLLLVGLGGLLALLSAPVAYWLGRVTELGVLLREKLTSINQPVALFTELRNALNALEPGAAPVLKVEQQESGTFATLFTVVTPAVSQLIIFIGALIFYLIYQRRIRDNAVFFLKDRKSRLTALRILTDIDEHMTVFFGTFTLVNIGLGLVTMLLTWSIGLPNPLLWGVVAGLLNYVPYIGPAVVTATLALVGILTFPTLAAAFIAPLIFIAIVTIEGHFLTPTIMGRRLELNPFAVFLAIAACTWLWGPIGAFLAVPLLMAMTVSLSHVFGDAKPHLPE